MDSKGHWFYVFFAWTWGLAGIFMFMPHNRWLTTLYITSYFLCIAGLASPRLPFSVPGLHFIRSLFYEEVPRINAPPAYALRLWTTLAASVLLLLYVVRTVLVLVQFLRISRGA